MGEGLNAATRQAQRARRIPDGARCAVCGFSDPVALEAWGDQWLCYEHANEKRGKATMERHHVLPDGLDPATVAVPGNMHRVLSEMQRDLPAEVRKAAVHDPGALIITIVSAVRAFALATVQFLDWVIAWLVRQWEALKARYGKEWWKKLGLPGLYPAPAQ